MASGRPTIVSPRLLTRPEPRSDQRSLLSSRVSAQLMISLGPDEQIQLTLMDGTGTHAELLAAAPQMSDGLLDSTLRKFAKSALLIA